MAKYRVKPGCWHGAHGQHGPGDVVEYEPHEAAGFADKLELIDETAAAVAPEGSAAKDAPPPAKARPKRGKG